MTTASRRSGTPRSGGRRRRASRSVESTSLAAPFLAEVAEPVRDQLAASVALRDFLPTAGTLTLEERRLLVEQALVLLEQNFVHLPLKAAMHAVNPVQRLRLLRVRLERQTSETMDREWLFHAELSGIFHSVRDLHTNYLLPSPFAGKVAFLPFRVEEYFDDAGTSHYVVAGVVQGFSAPGFGPGAEVTHWGGIPIDRAVDLNAARFAGSNAAARHSRGVQSLTVRPLVIHLPPDEEWVTRQLRRDRRRRARAPAGVVGHREPAAVRGRSEPGQHDCCLPRRRPGWRRGQPGQDPAVRAAGGRPGAGR